MYIDTKWSVIDTEKASLTPTHVNYFNELPWKKKKKLQVMLIFL